MRQNKILCQQCMISNVKTGINLPLAHEVIFGVVDNTSHNEILKGLFKMTNGKFKPSHHWYVVTLSCGTKYKLRVLNVYGNIVILHQCCLHSKGLYRTDASGKRSIILYPIASRYVKIVI